MRKWIALVFVLCSAPAWAAIAHGGSCSGTTSCTPSTSAAFQVDFAFAYRSGSTAAPSLPSGWISIATPATSSGGTPGAMRVACRVEYTATPVASGTFTNATNVGIVSFTGTGARAPQDCQYVGVAMGGVSTANAKTSSTVSYNTITMTNSGGSSWVIGAMGDSTTANGCTPSGMSNVSGATTGDITVGDTNGGVSSWSTTTCNPSTGSTTWVSYVLEVLVPSTGPSELSQLVWSYMASGNTIGSGVTVNGYRIHMEPALSGNTTLLALSYPQTAGTPTITDDNGGNTWTSDKTCSNGTSTTINLFRSSNTNVGTSVITVTFGSATYLNYAVVELNGVLTSSPVDNSVCNAAVTPSTTTLGNLANSAFTTTSDGDLIVHFVFDETLLTAGSPVNYDMIYNTSWTGFNSTLIGGAADEGFIQTTHGSITPKMTVVQTGGFDAWDALAVAYKTGAGGTATAYGVRREQYDNFNEAAAGFQGIVFPCASGNFIVGPLVPGDTAVGTWTLTAVVDTAGNTWNEYHPGGGTGYGQMWYTNSSAVCNGQDFLMMLATNTAAVGNDAMYEVVNALTSSALDTGAKTSNTGTTANTEDTHLTAAVTTTGQTSWTVAANSVANGTYEMVGAEVVQVTAGGGTTTFTVTRGVWGSTAATHASSTSLYPSLATPAPAVTTASNKEVIFQTAVNTNGPVYDTVNCQMDFGWGIGLNDNSQFSNGDETCHQYEATAGTYNLGQYLDSASTANNWYATSIAVKLQSSSAVTPQVWIIQ